MNFGFEVTSSRRTADMAPSAVTDTCGMAVLLGRLPWNRERTPR